MSRGDENVEQRANPKPNIPWKLKLFTGAFSGILNASFRLNVSVNRRLLNFIDFKVPPSPSPNPPHGVASSDTTVDSSRNLWFRLYDPTPTGGEPNDVVRMPVIVFFHGGGFVFGNANSNWVDKQARQLARELRAIVVSVNYRLAPEHRFPCQYEDGFDALRFIDEMDGRDMPANADLNRCFLAGESAGGNLAHHVAVRAGEYGFKRVKLLGLIAVQPFFGGEERVESEIRFSRGPILSLDMTDWFWRAFLPGGSVRNHPGANVFGSKADEISSVRFPSTLVFTGGFDPLRDWDMRYYEGLKRSGKEVFLVDYPNAAHGFWSLGVRPECRLFIEEMREFMQKQMDK
ncbi:probable carboxylesterase 18 [Corylus avellana]|uniref:probable carboxylesterase 18 n=1 Tax=Corylus avellana TaxID=13451 RepID=UPI001E1FC43E|nr:probable carboxylesterase 18 [Corylus avellana]